MKLFVLGAWQGTGALCVNAALVAGQSSSSRADVAAFLVESCESPAFVGKAVELGGR